MWPHFKEPFSTEWCLIGETTPTILWRKWRGGFLWQKTWVTRHRCTTLQGSDSTELMVLIMSLRWNHANPSNHVAKTILPKADMNEIGDASHPNCLRVRAQPGHLLVFAGYFPSCICYVANLSGPTSLLLSNHVVTPMSVVNMEFNCPCL